MTAIKTEDMDLNSASLATLVYIIADLDERLPR
jgi:hypothetical protein